MAVQDETSASPPRIAIVSTPRTGNTWLMHLLSTLYQVPALPVASPQQVDWAALPPGCVLQVHWHHTGPFLAQLALSHFQVVVLTRHPLDVLISILHFALHNRTGRWLEGEEGDERSIYGAMPRSTVFREYATGKRAAALLAVSRAWWQAPGCLSLRYEDLTADPHGELTRLAGDLGGTPHRSVAEAVAANTIPHLRQRFQNRTHFWLGRPGLWKQLLPAAEARSLAHALAGSLEAFGYTCEPDPNLDGAQADAHWIQLVGAELAEHLHKLGQTRQDMERTHQVLSATRQTLGQARQDQLALQQDLGAAREALHTVQSALHASQQELREVRGRLRGSQEALAEATAQLEETRTHLARFAELGPTALAVAQKLRAASRRHPRLAALVRRMLRPAA